MVTCDNQSNQNWKDRQPRQRPGTCATTEGDDCQGGYEKVVFPPCFSHDRVVRSVLRNERIQQEPQCATKKFQETLDVTMEGDKMSNL